MSVQIAEFLHLNGGCCWMQLHWKTLLPSKDIVTIIEECIRASPAASSKPPCTDEVQQSHPVCSLEDPCQSWKIHIFFGPRKATEESNKHDLIAAPCF